MYFRSHNESIQEGDVDVHGANVHLALLLATVGVRMNRSPLLDDDCQCGRIDFLAHGMSPPLAILWGPDNLGKSFEAFPACSGIALPRCPYNFIFPGTTPRQIALAAIDPYPRNAERRTKLCAYLNQYFSYFKEEYIIHRLVNVLMNDNVTLSALQFYFSYYYMDWNVDEDERDIRYWFWDFESDIPKLRINRAIKVFNSLGILSEKIYGDRDSSVFEVDSDLNVRNPETVGDQSQQFLISSVTHRGWVLSYDGIRVVTSHVGMSNGEVWTVRNMANGTITLSSLDRLLYCDSSGHLGMQELPQIDSDHISTKTEFAVTMTDFGGVNISSAAFDGMYLRCDGRGVANLTSTPSQWELWTMYRLGDGSPYEQFLGKKIRFKNLRHDGRCLICDAHGHVSAASVMVEDGSWWRLVETGLGSVVFSNETYRNKNLQCNPHGCISTCSNRLSWEHWTLAAPDVSLLQELEINIENSNLYCICSDEFEIMRLICSNDGRVSGTSTRSSSEIWELETI